MDGSATLESWQSASTDVLLTMLDAFQVDLHWCHLEPELSPRGVNSIVSNGARDALQCTCGKPLERHTATGPEQKCVLRGPASKYRILDNISSTKVLCA